ncbi:hypothetical protein L7F22_009605 [Adiantum nelumboides]|nr:hypothetical protein [Adiantum nelumboides]
MNNQGGQGGGDQQGQQGSGSGGFNIGDIAGIVNHAQNHDQSNNGDQQLFGQVASFLQSRAGSVKGDVNENELMNSHEKVNNGTDPVNSHEIGNAAALGAIRNVLGSGGSGDGNSGDFQQKLIGAAMAQAGKLFDQKQSAGQAGGGSKEDAMNKAGEQVMKLLVKNQVSGMIGGGNSGGLSGLMKLI